MRSLFISIPLFIFVIFGSVSGQPVTENSVTLEQMLEQNAGSGDDQPDLTELTENFTEFLRHPLNLNKATEPELLASGLFTPAQAHALLAHREKFGALLALPELQVVEGFDENFIRQLLPYLITGRAIDEPNAGLARMISEGTHSIISRVQWIPEKKRGFAEENGVTKYKGDPFSLYTRYQFNFRNKLSWCVVAEKDAGEQFFAGAQKQGFDFYSGNFTLRKTGPFRIITIGDYQLEYGQGLTLWTGLSGGKPADPSLIMRLPQGIKPYTSSNEVFFKRGIAVSLQWKRWCLDGFYSFRKKDGNLGDAVDTLSEPEYITSLQESGYHRTDAETEDKNAITEITCGGHLGYSSGNFKAGLTAVNTRFSLPLRKNIQPYNRFEFSGDHLFDAGLDYSWLLRNFYFFGEVSQSELRTMATVNGMVFSPDSRLTLSILHRYYPRNFHNLNASAFRESGNNYNEAGIYVGASLKLSRTITVTCNYDQFLFPWLRYRTDAPTAGYEFSGMVSYKPSRNAELYVRYRETTKWINTSDDEVLIEYPVPVLQKGTRVHFTSKVSKSFTLRSRAEVVLFNQEVGREKGMMIYQDVQYHPMGVPVSFNIRYALFDTDSYDARIYAYENDVLYGYSIPAYYYKGERFYVNIRYKVIKGIDCWFRYAATFYSNRNIIGSGWDEIKGSRKSELKFQVRFEF